MRRKIIHLTLPALALILILPAAAPAQIAARKLVCPADPIPRGFIKVDEISRSGVCGGNAWIAEIYTNKAPGSAMTVCADQPTPAGWQELELTTNTGQCAAATKQGGNIKAIVRVE